MNLTTILGHLGCGDGAGNTSSTRLTLLLGVLSVLGAYIYVAIHTGVMPEVPASNLELVGILVGGKMIQNTQEKDTPAPTKAP